MVRTMNAITPVKNRAFIGLGRHALRDTPPRHSPGAGRNSPVKHERAPLTPIKQESAFNTPIKQEQAPYTPIKQERAPFTPIKQKRAPFTPIKQERAPYTPIKQESAFNTPIKQEQALHTPMKQEQVSITPIHRVQGGRVGRIERAPYTPIKQERAPYTPIKQERAPTTPTRALTTPIHRVRGGRVGRSRTTPPSSPEYEPMTPWSRWTDSVPPLAPSRARPAPANSILKRPVPKGEYEPTTNEVDIDEEMNETFEVRNYKYTCPYAFIQCSYNKSCGCRKCVKRNKDPHTHMNTVSIEVFSMRLRGDISKSENTVDIDERLLEAKFNEHRMLGEALQGKHNYFLYDLYHSQKNKARLSVYQELYATQENALELMRHKRRKNTFFKLCQTKWEWLCLDTLAPEIRSSEPHTELDIHWERVEDAQMRGHKLDKKSNKKQTKAERRALRDRQVSRAVMPNPATPKITFEGYMDPFSDLTDEAGENMRDTQPLKVKTRPDCSNLWR